MINRFAQSLAIAVATCSCFTVSAAESTVPAAVTRANEMGITPELLVLADIAGGEGGTSAAVLNRIDQAVALRHAVVAASSAMESSEEAVTDLAEQLQAVGCDESLNAEYQQAISDLASIRSGYLVALEALRDEALRSIDSEKVQRLDVLQGAATRHVPAEFRVLDLTDSEWSAVEKAVRAERRALRLDEPLNAEHAQLLADLRSNVDVIDAQYRLSNHLTAVEQVFSQFSSE